MNSVIRKNWRDAATLIVLCRNNREVSLYNYKVLLQTRTHGPMFRNAVVFPGGVTEPCDADDEWLKLFQSFGYTQQDFRALHRNNTSKSLLFQNNPIQRHISLRITAIRETFEELGLLICSRENKSENSGSWGSVLDDIDVKYWQKKVISNPTELLNLCKEVNCYPDIWSLNYWSNWLTPVAFMKKRFNTAFFLVALESEPTVIEGNIEVAKVEWLNPLHILDESKKQNVKLYPPQSYELNRLAAWNNIEDISSHAQDGASFSDDLFYHVTVQAKDGILYVYPGDDLFPSNVDYHKSTEIDINKTISELRNESTNAHRFEFNSLQQTHLVLKGYTFNKSNMAETVIPCYLTMSVLDA